MLPRCRKNAGLSEPPVQARLGNERQSWCSIKGRTCPWYNSVGVVDCDCARLPQSRALFWRRKSPAFFPPAIDGRFTARLLAAPRDLSIALTRSWNVTFGKLPMQWRWMMDSWKSGNWIHRLRQLIYPFNLFSDDAKVSYIVASNDVPHVNVTFICRYHDIVISSKFHRSRHRETSAFVKQMRSKKILRSNWQWLRLAE